MPLIIELEALLLSKHKKSADIVRATGHTSANVSKFRNGKIKSIRLGSLLDMCEELDCQPGDIIKYVTDEELVNLRETRAQAAAERLMAGLEQPIAPERVYVVELED